MSIKLILDAIHEVFGARTVIVDHLITNFTRKDPVF